MSLKRVHNPRVSPSKRGVPGGAGIPKRVTCCISELTYTVPSYQRLAYCTSCGEGGCPCAFPKKPLAPRHLRFRPWCSTSSSQLTLPQLCLYSSGVSFVRRDKPSAGMLLYLDCHNQAHTAQHTIAKVRYVHLSIFEILMTLVTANKSW